MGSQNVTNFSAARKKKIQSGISGFEPGSPSAASQARQASVAAMGTFAPSSSFVLALTSASVDTAAKTLGELVAELKASKSPQKAEEILGRYGVRASDPHPYASLVAGLRQRLEERLSAASSKTEAAESAADAIGGTVLDVIKGRLPEKSEPADVSPKELVRAIRGTPAAQFSPIFLQNLISSLLRQTLDAARGRIPRRKLDALVQRVTPTLTRELAADLARPDVSPTQIREKLKRILES